MIPDLAERLRALPQHTLTALAFFSRLPVRPRPGAFDLRQAAGAWPVAGFILTLPAALFLWIATAAGLFVGGMAVYLALVLLIASTGAMHEDGLADTTDGFGGGRDRETRLAIMRDSRIGTYGVLALVATFLIRAQGLGGILFAGHYYMGAVGLLMIAVISRGLALWHWSDTSPARIDGMARSAGEPDRLAFLTGMILSGIAALVLVVLFRYGALVGIVLALLGIFFFSQFCRRLIGGHTGDTIGAAQQIAEVLLFVGLATSWRLFVFALEPPS